MLVCLYVCVFVCMYVCIYRSTYIYILEAPIHHTMYGVRDIYIEIMEIFRY